MLDCKKNGENFMYLSRLAALVVMGSIWVVIGSMLLAKGIKWLIMAVYLPSAAPSLFISYFNSEVLALIVAITLSFAIGFAKGVTVLKKAAEKMISRAHSFSGRIPLTKVFPVRFYILIAGMMGLGFLMKMMPFFDVRGIIDVTVGSALILGSSYYFKAALVADHL